MKFSSFILLFFLCSYLSAQSYKASLNEDCTIQLEAINIVEELHFRDNLDQLPGFPKVTVANPSFKNFRNVTLIDLDGDEVEDILWATNNKLFAYNADGLLWEKNISGVGIYPPSVADINLDGEPEIVQVTGGIPNAGRIYVMDKTGEDLSGWPVNLGNNWILTAPALSDLDGDNIMEIVILERDPPAGNVHIFKLDGTSFSNNWPVTLDGTPAITPSIGDVDNDGEKDIVVYSTSTRYILGLDGQVKMGFPLTTAPAQRYSFQSPLLVDFDGDQTLEIVGATHGDTENPDPKFYIMNSDGSDRLGWPIDVPDDNWTFNTPTVVKIDGEFKIFMSRPIGDNPLDMLFGWDSDGNLLPGFPIQKAGGLEGIISVADVDNDNEFELVFGSNLLVDGNGFIHAYELDGSGEVEGFPLRPIGLSFMNGAAIGDINGDGMMDISALSYTQNFGATTDSVYLNVYNLEVPYTPEKVLWSTYKGSNTRTGLLGEVLVSNEFEPVSNETIQIKISPNPTKDQAILELDLAQKGIYEISLLETSGRALKTIFSGHLNKGTQNWTVQLNNLPPALYWINIRYNGVTISASKLMLKK